jgi:hypothetical protein
MNIPLFVLNKTLWRNYPATSVPYFDDRCGKVSIVNSDILQELNQFIDNIKIYNPRSFIMDNHTDVKSASRYIDILAECHK